MRERRRPLRAGGRHGRPRADGCRRARRPPARAPKHDRAAARLGRARPRRLHGLPVEDPARRARGAAPRLAQRPPVAAAAPPRPAAGRVGDPRRRRGDRDHVPPHGRRARHRADPRAAARTRSASSQPPDDVLSASSARPSARRWPRRSSGWRPATRATPQPEGGDYETFFDGRRRVARPLAPGGRGAPARVGLALRDVAHGGTRGALLELDGDDGARARDVADRGRRTHGGSTAATGRSGSSRRRSSARKRPRRPPIRLHPRSDAARVPAVERLAVVADREPVDAARGRGRPRSRRRGRAA